ncbi:uncharacterized protein Z518_02970 [Rhinocladiella mackenziei CBS 650.93]|uniref:Rhinocladiella mackenziei CBS 650.93 unplaced genomic scaffold supercont1.2, whole genome shotgun sequence n=1 Tax=Rhinocladiella mackenziei CBS 650.93 TaxID=1442369 RepID=A0A0D2IQR0_9EURO|nr:uncharacterized protein Z518_02970 [Rhinocladiella mackenziei CBS 650.93]KIX08314.1 hypothetical protein Z518_02970 [Rhinocladiella mackenziei CBS 650.93]
MPTSTVRQRRKGTKEARVRSHQRAEPEKTPTWPVSEEEDDMSLDASSIVSVLRRQPVWIVLSVSSGACAALNGVFAKLTTTALTSTLSAHIATFLSLSPTNAIIEFLVRGTFFLLNLAFNAVMWALFTAALTRADSTTRVSIVNVSANFIVTAILGWMIFSEKLNGVWWGGACMLAVGNVVIGRREESQKPGRSVGLDESAREAEEAEGLLSPAEVELDDTADAGLRERASEEHGRLRKAEEVDDPI